LSQRPWAGLGLESIAAFLMLVICAPVDVLVPLLQQWDVLRAVDVGALLPRRESSIPGAPTGGLGRGDHLWCHVWPRQDLRIRHDVGLPLTCSPTVLWKKSTKIMPIVGFSTRLPTLAMTHCPGILGTRVSWRRGRAQSRGARRGRSNRIAPCASAVAIKTIS